MSGGLRLFSIGDEGVAEITARGAVRERHLQDLVEANMEALPGVRFLASEYSTGARHRGRIDSLGLDENGAPVIVEYKRERGANVISQGLFYLSWLVDHRGEFQLLVRERLGKEAASQVLWSAPRVICIAENFTRYDLHAVHEMGRTIDLVTYRCFSDSLLTLETVASVQEPGTARRTAQQPARPAAPTSGESAEGSLAALREALHDTLLALGEDTQQVERQTYDAYRRLRNFACVVNTRRDAIVMYLKAGPDEFDLVDGFSRDVRGIGHHGTGDLEVRLRSRADLQRADEMVPPVVVGGLRAPRILVLGAARTIGGRAQVVPISCRGAICQKQPFGEVARAS
ncbi:DUF5655 domain-containing protein [Streptomyces roseifaciens]|uniref:DUF5655 domain-containing protein n=1 Tax=Streptomyces roseifaciens TaxID=1488406 RepID=UPI0007C6F895|nr:DUF5655 domain-containing protein [Streptomyces roseifaciens]